jgi:hypothetical protein
MERAMVVAIVIGRNTCMLVCYGIRGGGNDAW